MIRQFDPAEVTLTIDGHYISDFAEGTYISIERDDPIFRKVSGCDNVITRVRIPNTSGSVTITLMQGGFNNYTLNSIARDQESGDADAFTLTLQDSNATNDTWSTYVSSPYTWLRSVPVVQYGDSLQAVEWVFDCRSMDIRIGQWKQYGGYS